MSEISKGQYEKDVWDVALKLGIGSMLNIYFEKKEKKISKIKQWFQFNRR